MSLLARSWHAIAARVGFVLFGLAHRRRSFTFAGRRYRYHAAIYNGTYRNERTVELAIALPLFEENANRRVLEVGNVTSHYVTARHRIVDKYEADAGVENTDVLSIRSVDPYDLIICISTLEHIGLDELRDHPYVEDADKPRQALEHLAGLLAPGGTLLVTFGLGYNPSLDAQLHSGTVQFDELRFLKRTSRDNRWREVAADEVRGTRYGSPYPAANAVAIGVRRGSSPQPVRYRQAEERVIDVG